METLTDTDAAIQDGAAQAEMADEITNPTTEDMVIALRNLMIRVTTRMIAEHVAVEHGSQAAHIA